MPVVIVQKWEESERGWGTRPDGYSIHRTHEDMKRYLADYWAAELKRNPSGIVPDEYSRADGSPYEAIVDDATYASLEGKRGVRVYNNNYPGCGGHDGWVPVTR